jgi:hypothetical protein
MKSSGPVLLVALLCTTGLVQRMQIAVGEQPGNPEPLHDIAGEKSLAVRQTSCPGLRKTLQDFVVPGRGTQPTREIPIWQLPDSKAFFFESGMTIDADGAPNAYHPDDTGLDELSNAGSSAEWNGIVTDEVGSPLIQKHDDPFPGYYISCTSLSDHSKRFNDPTRYVDASKIPYVVLPQKVADAGGAKLGDFAVVTNLQNGKSSFAIYADIGTLGEGSIALADNLGIRSNARSGGQRHSVLYLVFPNSGNLAPRSLDEIRSEGGRLLDDWGGLGKLHSCAQTDDSAGENPRDTL